MLPEGGHRVERFERQRAPTRHGSGELELKRLGSVRDLVECADAFAQIVFPTILQPSKVGLDQFEAGSVLAKGCERILVERLDGFFHQPFQVMLEAFLETIEWIPVWQERDVVPEALDRRLSELTIVGWDRTLLDFHRLEVRRKHSLVDQPAGLKQLDEVVAVKMVITLAVEITHGATGRSASPGERR